MMIECESILNVIIENQRITLEKSNEESDKKPKSILLLLQSFSSVSYSRGILVSSNNLCRGNEETLLPPWKRKMFLNQRKLRKEFDRWFLKRNPPEISGFVSAEKSNKYLIC